jgi:hypothetical protein
MKDIDMSIDWDWKTNLPEHQVWKTPNPNTHTPAPSVARGGLYAGGSNDNNIYLYGGTTTFENTSSPFYTTPGSALYTLWSYNTLSTTWNQYDSHSVCPEAPNRPNAGAWDVAQDQGLAFYFNGQVDSGSSYDTMRLGSYSYPITGMMVIDTINQTARNVSTDSVGSPRTRAGLTYIPSIGTYGIVVVLGGITQSFPNTNGTGTVKPVRSNSWPECSCEWTH